MTQVHAFHFDFLVSGILNGLVTEKDAILQLILWLWPMCVVLFKSSSDLVFYDELLIRTYILNKLNYALH